jgi:FtsZ-binding cell division protein ZapB
MQEDVVSSLEEKIKRVIRVAEELGMDNERLQQEVDGLLRQLSTKNREIEVLESKYQNLKLAKNLISSQEDVGAAKFRVNRMMREIDKCIALLNR